MAPSKKNADKLKEETSQKQQGAAAKQDDDQELQQEATGTMLRFTSIPVFQNLIAKNVYSNYMRQDSQQHLLRKDDNHQSRNVKRQKVDSRAVRDTSLDIDPSNHTPKVGTELGEYEESMNGEGAVDQEEEQQVRGSRVIVIHPGSQNLRIGRASDTYPKNIPHVIARKVVNEPPIKDETFDWEDEESYEKTYGETSNMQKSFDILNEELKNRMRAAKRRMVPNAHQLVCSFNRSVTPENIPDHNDPYRVEWTSTNSNSHSQYFIGAKALRIPNTKTSDFRLFYPIRHGTFNVRDYASKAAVLGDIQTIWTDVLVSEFEIDKKEFSKFSVMLIVPDVYSVHYVYDLADLLLRIMCFRRVCIIQESVCTTFGAGISTACVVDIGAQKTSISCVEEGMILPDTRVHLKFGGDDITRFWLELLRKSYFPYKEVDLTKAYEYNLIEELKERFTSLNEADISINLYDFFVRKPGESTLKFSFKLFDEAMFAPTSLFYPIVFHESMRQKGEEIMSRRFDCKEIEDTMEYPGPPLAMTLLCKVYPVFPTKRIISVVQNGQRASEDVKMEDAPAGFQTAMTSEGPTNINTNMEDKEVIKDEIGKEEEPKEEEPPLDPEETILEVPLDVAITHSLLALAGPNVSPASISMAIERAKKFYSSIVVVGGGSLHVGLAHYLEQRLLRSRPKEWLDSSAVSSGNSIEGIQTIQVVPPPRDLDPRILTWKGGSVLSRIDVVEDLWIKLQDWDLFGARAIKDRVLMFW